MVRLWLLLWPNISTGLAITLPASPPPACNARLVTPAVAFVDVEATPFAHDESDCIDGECWADDMAGVEPETGSEPRPAEAGGRAVRDDWNDAEGETDDGCSPFDDDVLGWSVGGRSAWSLKGERGSSGAEWPSWEESSSSIP